MNECIEQRSLNGVFRVFAVSSDSVRRAKQLLRISLAKNSESRRLALLGELQKALFGLLRKFCQNSGNLFSIAACRYGFCLHMLLPSVLLSPCTMRKQTCATHHKMERFFVTTPGASG